ncbi:hypothetical protein V8E53_007168 [Lactarius tabidus]
MDDETAEIELVCLCTDDCFTISLTRQHWLEQNLNKTRQISQRMTMRPVALLAASRMTMKRITGYRKYSDEAASNQEGIVAEEALMLRGHIGASKREHRLRARLVETGAKKLAQLFTKLVASGSTGSHPTGSDFQYFPFPRDGLAMLLQYPRQTILSSLKEAQCGYAEMRGSWASKCLEVYGRRVIDRAETTDGVASGQELGKWTGDLLTVIELITWRAERKENELDMLVKDVFPLVELLEHGVSLCVEQTRPGVATNCSENLLRLCNRHVHGDLVPRKRLITRFLLDAMTF